MGRAFEDNSLQIFYCRAADGCYVDRDGTRVRLPGIRGSMAVTKLESAGEPVAAIVHDSVTRRGLSFHSRDRGRGDGRHRKDPASIGSSGLAAPACARRGLHPRADRTRPARRRVVAEAIEERSTEAAAMVERIGTDMEAAIDELRCLVHGIYLPLLGGGRAPTGARRRGVKNHLADHRSVASDRWL
jgi:hypothetical protein